MKLNLYLLITLLFFFSITSKAQIYADTILNEHGVADAKSIISGSTSDYAVLQPGLNDSASVTLGFTQHGLPGMYCTVTLKQDDAQLSDSLLKRLSFTVYDTEGNVLVQKDSFYVGNVNYVEGTQNFFKISLEPDDSAKGIGFIKISLAGSAAQSNKLRVFNALINFSCGGGLGNLVDLPNVKNVQNPSNAISASKQDYALLTPTKNAGSAISIYFPSDNYFRNTTVKIIFGLDNTPLTNTLINNIKLKLSGSSYIAPGGFETDNYNLKPKDVVLMDSGKFYITISINKNDKPFHVKPYAVQILFSDTINGSSTLRLYYAKENTKIQNAIAPTLGYEGLKFLCDGDSVSFSSHPGKYISGPKWQWYKNYEPIAGAESNTYTAKTAGTYFVVDKLDGCANISRAKTIIVTNCTETKPINAVKIYPNPFTAFTVLDLKNVPSASSIIITDKSGNLIQTIRATTSKQVKLLQNAQPGIYFINLTNIDGTMQTSTVIKQ